MALQLCNFSSLIVCTIVVVVHKATAAGLDFIVFFSHNVCLLILFLFSLFAKAAGLEGEGAASTTNHLRATIPIVWKM